MEINLLKRKIVIPKPLYWREVLAVLLLLIGIYFFHQQRHEVSNIIPYLHTAHKGWLSAAALISFIYILCQSAMYFFSFRAIGSRLSLRLCIELFLKRSFLSVFLPGGGVSALAYIPTHIKKKVNDKLVIYQASALFGFAGVLSTFIISLVVLLSSLGNNEDTNGAVSGLLLLFVFIFLLLYIFYIVKKEKKLFRWLQHKYPKSASRVKEIAGANVKGSDYSLAVFSSVGVEICGIIHLYIVMLAVGVQPSLLVSGLAYVVSVLLMVASPFLKGVGVIELSVSYILTRYGYTPVEALAITLVYRFFEFWLPLVLGLFAFLAKGKQLFLRVFPVFIIFLLGVVNILSVFTPPLADRMQLLKQFLPATTIHATNTLVIYTGVTLIITAAYLVRGLRNAWWLALVCAVISLAGHLFKGLDWEEASLALLVIVSLLFTKKQYTARVNPRLVNKAGLTGLIVFFALLVYGFVGFYFLEKRHFNIDFDRYQSLKNTLLIFLLQKTSVVPVTRYGSEFLTSMYVFATGAWLFLLYAFVKPYVSVSQLAKKQSKAVELAEKYGSSPVDFFKLADDKLFFFSRVYDGFVSYRIERGFAIALEMPVCLQNDKLALLKEFQAYCSRKGLAAAYYRVDEQDLSFFERLKKKYLLIGQEAIVNVNEFDLAGRDRKSLRNGLNSLQKKGMTTKVYHPPHSDAFLQSLEVISEEWLSTTKRKEMVFAQGKWDKEALRQQDVVVTTNSENKPVAFLNIIRDYMPGECTYDLIRKTEDAPGGCMDAMIIVLIQYAKDKGSSFLNLGLAPMSGLEGADAAVEKMMAYAYEKIRRFRHYRGLRSFKEKYATQWLNKYLIYDNDFDLIRLSSALQKAMKPLYEK